MDNNNNNTIDTYIKYIYLQPYVRVIYVYIYKESFKEFQNEILIGKFSISYISMSVIVLNYLR